MRNVLENIPETVRNEFLETLYKNWFAWEKRSSINWNGQSRVIETQVLLDLESWGKERGLEWSDVNKLFHFYRVQGVTHITYMPRRSGEPEHRGYVMLMPSGVKFCEDNGYAPEPYLTRSREVALALLEGLNLIWEASQEANMMGGIHIGPVDGVREIYEAHHLTAEEKKSAVEVLVACGWLEIDDHFSRPSMTEAGREYLSALKAKTFWEQKFEQLLTGRRSTPQQRGHELEALLADVAQSEGWQVETNTRTSGQEHDLIVFREREYYVVQCKWEVKTTQGHQISVLRDRVTSRPGMRGIFVTMSGFSKNALKDTAARLEAALILLYGPHDISDIFSGQKTFSDLLSAKYHAAIVGRKVDVDGNSFG